MDTGQAAFEVAGNFAWFVTAPGAEWVMATTPARHVFFVEASTGRCLGHIPASRSLPGHTLSPDGKTLLRMGPGLAAQAWDLQTGKRKGDAEVPLVPLSRTATNAAPAPVWGVREPRYEVFWVGPRWLLSRTARPGEEHPGYYLYDLDVHTHTYRYAPSQAQFRNDPLGRAWMAPRPGGDWSAPDVTGAGPFQRTLALGPGSTIRVELNAGEGAVSRKAAEKAATELHARGLKIGKDGWVLRGDCKTGTASTDLTDPSGAQRLSVASYEVHWRLLDPEGREAWQGTSGGKFDPFRSKYVVVGSRKTDLVPGGLGGGSSSIRLDYQGKDSMTAQVEEVREKTLFQNGTVPVGMPPCLVAGEGGYTALPLEAPLDPKQKP